MPMLPTDPEAARARAAKDEQRRAERALADQRATEHDEAIIREMANALRAKEGLPPLRPDEPVIAFRCRRGHRPEHH